MLPNTITISSLQTDGLQPYRTLRRPHEHYSQGIFVAEGEKVVVRLIESGMKILSALMTPEWFERLSGQGYAQQLQTVTTYLAEKQLVETIVGYNLHQGIMAVGKLPSERPLKEVLSAVQKPFFTVALDGLVNAENVGVVVRNCAAFGVDVIIAGETSGSPYLRRAVRNSMGTVFNMNVVHAINLQESLKMLKTQYNTKIIAAHPHEESVITKTDFTGNICIVLGNEGDGVSAGILDACTHHIAIPMMNGTDSLNVASASAVFLYEASKQRNSL